MTIPFSLRLACIGFPPSASHQFQLRTGIYLLLADSDRAALQVLPGSLLFTNSLGFIGDGTTGVAGHVLRVRFPDPRGEFSTSCDWSIPESGSVMVLLVLMIWSIRRKHVRHHSEIPEFRLLSHHQRISLFILLTLKHLPNCNCCYDNGHDRDVERESTASGSDG